MGRWLQIISGPIGTLFVTLVMHWIRLWQLEKSALWSRLKRTANGSQYIDVDGISTLHRVWAQHSVCKAFRSNLLGKISEHFILACHPHKVMSCFVYLNTSHSSPWSFAIHRYIRQPLRTTVIEGNIAPFLTPLSSSGVCVGQECDFFVTKDEYVGTCQHIAPESRSNLCACLWWCQLPFADETAVTVSSQRPVSRRLPPTQRW